MYSKDQLAEILRQYEYPDFLIDKTCLLYTSDAADEL